MSKKEIHVGDIGTVFERTVKDQDGNVVDVSTATTKDFIYTKSDGSKVTKDTEFTNDGSDGKLRYVTIADDLDIEGDWKLQVHVVLPGIGEWWSDISSFRVHGNL